MQSLIPGSVVWAPVEGAWRLATVFYEPGSCGPTHAIGKNTVIVRVAIEGIPFETWPCDARTVERWPDTHCKESSPCTSA